MEIGSARIACFVCVLACSTPPAPPNPCALGRGAIVCDGTTEFHCVAGEVESQNECDGVCVPRLGCRACDPGVRVCDGDRSLLCANDGSAVVSEDTCASGCAPESGTCIDLCAQAEEARSYIGCEYWPTPTANPVATDFEFAVVVANPQEFAAEITLYQGETELQRVSVPAGGVETIPLGWVFELKEPAQRSVIARDAAYRLTSTVPVTVYQFNPLEYEIDEDCSDLDAPDTFGDGVCNSFSNDASLLLPSHVLTGNYLMLGYKARSTRTWFPYPVWPGLRTNEIGHPIYRFDSSPGFASIVAIDEEVEIEIVSSAFIAAGEGVPLAHPGETMRFTLNRGDVLQLATLRAPEACGGLTLGPPNIDPTSDPVIGNFEECDGERCNAVIDYCDTGREYDLSGTEIRATGRLQVIAGHECAFVPHGRWACDHLEETLFPLESWGREYVVARTESLRDEPNILRVLSGRDGNQITFEPAVHDPITLDRGQMIELETFEDVRVTGTEALLVAQFLVGQDYDGFGASGEGSAGDPSLSFAIPVEQYRDEYAFIAPASYAESFAIVVSRGQEVLLDGTAITEWTPMEGLGYATARVPLSGGAHRMSSTQGFGLAVHGFGAYTSYMFPGGLDLEQINVPF